jgi:hypothetical protein
LNRKVQVTFRARDILTPAICKTNFDLQQQKTLTGIMNWEYKKNVEVNSERVI